MWVCVNVQYLGIQKDADQFYRHNDKFVRYNENSLIAGRDYSEE